jgi:hypothetical protein
VFLLGPVPGNPHDVGGEIGAGRLVEKMALNLRGPSEAATSGRGHQHEDAYLAHVSIESCPERLGVRIQDGVVRLMGAAGKTDCGEAGEQNESGA